MQHLLDFIQEHTLEEQLYFVAQCPSGALEVQWRRADGGEHWQLRPQYTQQPWQLVPRHGLILDLENRGADMIAVRRELNAMLAAQIAFADMVLRDANKQLGRDVVERFVVGHERFIRELQSAIERVSKEPRRSMEVIRGEGEGTALRAGHLTLVR